MPERLKSLPTFTCLDDDDKVNLWPQPPFQTTNREANELGHARAAEVIAFMRRTRDPSLLGHIVRAIAEGGKFAGMENGFFFALSTAISSPNIITEFVASPPERQFRVGRKFGHLLVVAPECVADLCDSAPAATAVA